MGLDFIEDSHDNENKDSGEALLGNKTSLPCRTFGMVLSVYRIGKQELSCLGIQ